MAKFYGSVGYSFLTEDIEHTGVWKETIIERKCYGELVRNARKIQASSINDDIISSNDLSILADPYAVTNFQNIKYATYMGTKWKVTAVEVQYPRLILTLGGRYNENENRAPY